MNNWQVEDGLPQNSVLCITQTSDGYLWFGTFEGLVRYNGKSFTVFNSKTNPLFSSDRIRALCEDDHKDLFIATSKSILRYTQGHFENVAFQKQSDEEFVFNSSLVKDKYGVLWAFTDADRLYCYRNNCFVNVPFGNTLSKRGLNHYSITKGGDGKIYIHAPDCLYCIDGGHIQAFPFSDLLPHQQILGIAEEPGKGILVVTKSVLLSFPSMAKKLFHYTLPHQNMFITDQSNLVWSLRPDMIRYSSFGIENLNLTAGIGENIIMCSSFDREGNLWIGSDGGGIFRISEPKVNFLSKAEGLAGDVVWSVCEDKDGCIWSTSMQAEAAKIEGTRISNIKVPSPLIRVNFNAAYPLKQGGIAIASSQLYQIKGTTITDMFPGKKELRYLQSVYEDENGNIWAGSVVNGLFLIKKDTLIHFSKTSGILHGFVSAIVSDGKGTVYVGSRGGLQVIQNNRIVKSYTIKDGLSDPWVRTLYYDRSGALWIGTDAGLNRLLNGKIISYTMADGLFNNVFHTILEDNFGNLWFSCNRGIYSVSKQQFALLDAKKIDKLQYRLFSREDGLKSEEGNGSTQPAGWKTADGRLLFAMSKGIAIIDPARMPINTSIPPVVIEEIRVDDTVMNCGNTPYIKLRAGNHNLSFSYAALSFSNPGRNSYAVLLQGFETKLKMVGAKTEIDYTNIPPGEYTFIVKACNNDGIWNDAGASIRIFIPKPFYATLWFQLLGALCIAGLGGYIVFVISRIKTRRRLAQMENAIKLERERARISRDIHDDVGSSLTKISILSELATRQTGDEGKRNENLKKISNLSRQAITDVTEIVWAMNPKNDGLENFAAYIREYIQKELEEAGIESSFEYPEIIPEMAMSSESRRNMFLIVKEIVHNCIKHAHASLLQVTIVSEPDSLQFIFTDNGDGFDAGELKGSGNGLTNMKERAAQMKATFAIQSVRGQGTRTTLCYYFR